MKSDARFSPVGGVTCHPRVAAEMAESSLRSAERAKAKSSDALLSLLQHTPSTTIFSNGLNCFEAEQALFNLLRSSHGEFFVEIIVEECLLSLPHLTTEERLVWHFLITLLDKAFERDNRLTHCKKGALRLHQELFAATP